MGNASSVREGVGEEEEMVESPPQSPRGAAQSPLLFAPQIPMPPLQRFDEPTDALMQNFNDTEDIICEKGIPTMITWSYGGKEVAVEGSWDSWKTRKQLQKSAKDFTIMKVLPSGVYHYRFIVDGEWRHAPDFPWMHDEMGNAYNILDLQDSVPDIVESIAGFEPPQSPESSYDNCPLSAEDFTKEPPLAPPQVHLTLLNTTPNAQNPSSLSRPQHAVLNHLYIQKGKSGQPVVALGSTCRFIAKYVTVVLYKSL